MYFRTNRSVIVIIIRQLEHIYSQSIEDYQVFCLTGSIYVVSHSVIEFSEG